MITYFSYMSQTWRIQTVEADETTDYLGLCSPTDLEIRILSHLAEDVRPQVLLHELFHVIEKTLNLQLTEEVVDTLAIGFLHLLSENPHLIEMIYVKKEKN